MPMPVVAKGARLCFSVIHLHAATPPCSTLCCVQGAFDAFAMGNYPFPSDYMTGEGQGELPAWPMRAACDLMSSLAPSAQTTRHTGSAAQAGAADQQTRSGQDRQGVQLGRKGLAGAAAAAGPGAQPVALQQLDLLDRLQAASSLLYNASGTVSCYSLDLAGPAAGSVGEWCWGHRVGTSHLRSRDCMVVDTMQQVTV